MKIASLLFFGIAAAILIGAGYAYDLPELGTASLFLGGLALLGLAFSKRGLVHEALALYGILAGVFGLFHVPPLICAGSLAAAVIGWDAGLIAPDVASASGEDRRRFALGYALRALAVAGFGILLVAAAGAIRISLTFGSGLGLSFAVLVFAALFLKALRRPEAADDDPRSDRK